MIINRKKYRDWEIYFTYSPLFELFCSLHVLFNPEHHKMRHQWALEMKQEMCSKLYNKLKHYDEVTQGWMGAMEFMRINDGFNDFNVIRGIDQMSKMDLEYFAYLMLNKEISVFDIKKIITLKKVHIDDLNQSQRSFILDVEAHRGALVSLLKEYHYLHFQVLQASLEPYLIRTLKSHKCLSEQMDFLDYIDTLHPRLEIRDDRISLHKYKRFDIMYDNLKSIEIGISTFIDPHLLVGFEDAHVSLHIRAKIEKYHNDVHEDLVIKLKALGDQTRMRIIKHLYKRPTSTQDLAVRLEISEAGISKHLKLLNRAGIIEKKREGNFMLYSLTPNVIDRVPMDVYQYLDE